MRKNFGAKPIAYPMPVFIIAAYGQDGVPNAMNAAWGGISEEDEISICVSPGHKTTKNIIFSGAFTVSMADADHVVECDYIGIVSGNDTPDKFAKAGFHAVRSGYVNAPLIEELPVAIECELISYNTESCRLVGRIINVCADEKVLNADGKIDPSKLRPIIFDPANHWYLVAGDKVGDAFKDGEKLK